MSSHATLGRCPLTRFVEILNPLAAFVPLLGGNYPFTFCPNRV
nr:MAG TPA: hypothetical protein [Caudoviricetes sp.]